MLKNYSWNAKTNGIWKAKIVGVQTTTKLGTTTARITRIRN